MGRTTARAGLTYHKPLTNGVLSVSDIDLSLGGTEAENESLRSYIY